MSRIIYHPGGYDPTATAENMAEQWDDAIQTYTAWDTSGNAIETRPYTPEETAAMNAEIAASTQADNQSALQQKAQTALAANETFLGIAAPTNAQAVAQMQALTRQVDALIRLAVNALDSTTGT